MGAISTILKGLFLLFNFVFWALGLALLIVGILAKVQFEEIVKLATDINFNIAPYIMIGCGAFIILVGFMGCWGSVKEHGWALKIYMFILVLLFIVEIVGAAAGYIMRNKLNGYIKHAFQNGIDRYHTKPEIKDAVDMLQEQIGCCGVTSFKDWFAPVPTVGGNMTTAAPQTGVPKSCCIDEKKCNFASVTVNTPAANATIHTTGCYDTVLSKTKSSILIIVGVSLGIAVFQVFGVYTAFKLVQRFKKHYEKM